VPFLLLIKVENGKMGTEGSGEMAGWTDVKTASEMLGKSIRTVQRLCSEGKLRSRKKGDRNTSPWEIYLGDEVDTAVGEEEKQMCVRGMVEGAYLNKKGNWVIPEGSIKPNSLEDVEVGEKIVCYNCEYRNNYFPEGRRCTGLLSVFKLADGEEVSLGYRCAKALRDCLPIYGWIRRV